jgi:putative DNA primase/helicase
MSLTFIEVKRKAESRWVDLIFPAFAIDIPQNKKHGACPSCGGNDRFRCDDKGGHGTWICNQCGAGDGFSLISLVRGMNSSEVLREVAAVLGIEKDSTITDAERDKWRAEAKAKELAAQKEKLRLQKICIKNAKTQWSKLDTIVESPYLIRKGVDNIGCRTDAGGLLYIPMLDTDGQMWNLQTIHPSGFKAFLPNARVSGTFHTLGVIDPLGVICIVEGYATGASVFMASGLATVISFNTANMKHVGRALRATYPYAKLLYCADNDVTGQDRNGEPLNAGITTATAIAAETNGRVVYPDFGYTAEQIQQAIVDKQAAKALIDAVDDEVAV